MNAAIRAVVRQQSQKEWKWLVSMTGYAGMVAGEIHPPDAASVETSFSWWYFPFHPALATLEFGST